MKLPLRRKERGYVGLCSPPKAGARNIIGITSPELFRHNPFGPEVSDVEFRNLIATPKSHIPSNP